MRDAPSRAQDLKDTAWRDDAACRDSAAEGFFPDSSDPREYDAPRAVCRRCPVRQECLADQLAWEGGSGSSARHGMYGGLTPEERHAVHRGRRGTEVTPRRHPVTPEQVEAIREALAAGMTLKGIRVLAGVTEWQLRAVMTDYGLSKPGRGAS